MLRIAIVGRPNVGKSTLFNRLAGRRLALVDDQPGVTRDRRFASGRLGDLDLELIDTAGFEDVADESLEARMRRQTELAVDEADLVLFVVDQTGVVICALRDSGQIYWMTDLNVGPPGKGGKAGKRSPAVWSSPILASGRLITVSSTGEAVALNAKTGAVERRASLGVPAIIGPIASGDMLYVMADNGQLIALR